MMKVALCKIDEIPGDSSKTGANERILRIYEARIQFTPIS